MKFWQRLVGLLIAGGVMSTAANESPAVMDGFPPSVESQVTKKNQRDWPYNQWAFQNFGAPNNTVMVPRAGEIHHFPRDEGRLNDFVIDGSSLAEIFEANAADALVVIQGDTLVHESYWNQMDAHRHLRLYRNTIYGQCDLASVLAPVPRCRIHILWITHPRAFHVHVQSPCGVHARSNRQPTCAGRPQ